MVDAAFGKLPALTLTWPLPGEDGVDLWAMPLLGNTLPGEGAQYMVDFKGKGRVTKGNGGEDAYSISDASEEGRRNGREPQGSLAADFQAKILHCNQKLGWGKLF